MKRFLHIDFLRAIAILAVMIIHVFSDNLTNKLNFYIWNYLHVIIVAFVFCSGYVLYAACGSKLTNFSQVAGWYKKRLLRLIIPFYWYLLVHYTLMLLFPKYFSGLGLIFSWKFILQSMLLLSGISLNWLPLLFLQLAIIFPILVVLFHRQRKIFWGYIIIAVLTTIGFTIWQFPYAQYRSVMWIPWSIFLVLPWYFYTKERIKANSKLYLTISAVSLIVFLLLFMLWQYLERSVTLIDNKYPPNLFYISYESFGSFLFLGIGVLPFFQQHFVRLYTFLSKASYNLFFLHYIVMDFMLSLNKQAHGGISVWVQTVFVVGVSMGVAYLVMTVPKFYRENQ